MKTPQTHFGNEQVMIKDLFQQLFHLQILLEKFNDLEISEKKKTNELIEIMDQLLQLLIDNYPI